MTKRMVSLQNHQTRLNQSAFTLAEVLVVIFIVGIIGVITLANYQAGSRKSDLATEAQKMASIFKRAQNMALTGYKRSGSLTDYGYGIYIATPLTATYKLFIDQGTTAYRWDTGSSDESIQDFSLASNIEIVSADCTDLVFKRPYGEVYCDGVLLSALPAKTFTLRETGENSYRYVRVNYQGQVDILPSL